MTSRTLHPCCSVISHASFIMSGILIVVAVVKGVLFLSQLIVMRLPVLQVTWWVCLLLWRCVDGFVGLTLGTMGHFFKLVLCALPFRWLFVQSDRAGSTEGSIEFIFMRKWWLVKPRVKHWCVSMARSWWVYYLILILSFILYIVAEYMVLEPQEFKRNDGVMLTVVKMSIRTTSRYLWPLSHADVLIM